MIIFITGTSSGLGSYLANSFLKDEKNLVIGCSRNNLKIKNKRYFHYKTDLKNLVKTKKMLNEIKKKFKKIDILINNAAYLEKFKPLLLVDDKEMLDSVNVNLISLQLITKEILKLMIPRNYGRIINIGSISSKLLDAGDTIYSTSKLGVTGFTKSLSKEIFNYGITCNCICPTIMNTKKKNLIDDKIQKKIIESGAIKYENKNSDILNLVKYISSKKTNFLTGQVIYLGGH